MDMMLSDRDLNELAITQQIVNPFIPQNCKGATINLTLDSKIKKYISDKEIVMGDEIQPEQYEEIDISKEPFLLKPNESVLVQSVESFNVPDDMSAQINERYSIKLLGLYISPASYMNPGYRGTMSFVAYNQSPVPIRLVPGIKFAQLALFKLSSVSDNPYWKQDAKYMGATEVSISKLHLDNDIQEFLNQKGIINVSNETANELGGYLMGKIKSSAEKIADELRAKFGDPNK
jgi:dCTP deaminase